MQIETDWSTDSIVGRRERYYAASQRKFVPYETPLILRRGERQYLWDEAGKRYTDLLAMNLCISVGHAHPEVIRAAQAQAADLTHCTTMFYHPVPTHLAEELAATMPKGPEWVVHFTNSGAEAIDLALLMARSFTGRIDFLSLSGGYHGATAGAQALCGISGFRHDVPQLGGISFVAEPHPYRGVFGPAPEPYLDEIERVIAHNTSGRLAGMVLEPVQGYGGIVPLPDGYVAGAAERVRAAGGLMVIDEVQAGFGRTGDHFWSFEAHGLVPEIVVLAKGIANGFPLGAVIAQRHVAEPMAEKFLFHTYGANPVSCAAGRAGLRVMAEERRLYLIDEPTKGLAPAIIGTLVGALRDLKAQGASILLVEQNFAVAKALGDSCAVMDDGRVVWTGAMQTLADDTALQERLMGLSMEAA